MRGKTAKKLRREAKGNPNLYKALKWAWKTGRIKK